MQSVLYGVFLVVFGVLLTFYSLGLFTRHGDEFPVPDFCAQPLAKAYQLAEKYHLELVLTDSSYVVTQRPGTVLQQQPAAGEKVKRGRHIFLSINACAPMRVSAPNLVGETLRQALILLDQSGLQCGELSQFLRVVWWIYYWELVSSRVILLNSRIYRK